MKKTMRRSFAMLMALMMAASLFFGISMPAQAATVNYVKDGKYIYNWGERGETATFLSPMAEDFYEENNTSYEELAALAGSSNVSSVPSSALYKELQSLMKKNHSHITGYQETRTLYQYTDCQNSGGSISSFYSGKAIGPAWDSGKTWNREHVWPDSKGLAGDDENDIMMLRPTSVSENSSRGNKAYGESSGYYNPNGESNGAHDLRGDVARITLYIYVRWGNTGKMWGSSGVMESKEVLIKWMKADPVDTWELGRNDSVEAITGTRNVFVDYPELAFELFEEEIPANYVSPSGEGAKKDIVAPTIAGVTNGSTYETSQTVTVTDENLASVTVNGKEVGATFTLDANANQEYTIIATDKSGNQTTVVVTMKIAEKDNQNENSNSGNNSNSNSGSSNNNNTDSNNNDGNTNNNGNSNNTNTGNNTSTDNNQKPVTDVPVEESTSENTNQNTETPSNTEEKNDTTSESDKNDDVKDEVDDDVEDKDDSKEEQEEEKGKIPMEAIFLVMLIVGVVALVALIISDRKAKGNNNTADKE